MEDRFRSGVILLTRPTSDNHGKTPTTSHCMQYFAPAEKLVGNGSIVLEGLGRSREYGCKLEVRRPCQGRQRAKVLPHLVQRIARFSSSADYGASLSSSAGPPPARTDRPPARRTRHRHRCNAASGAPPLSEFQPVDQARPPPPPSPRPPPSPSASASLFRCGGGLMNSEIAAHHFSFSR